MVTPAILIAVLVVAGILIVPSIRIVGPTEVGLVIKRFGRKLGEDNPIAFNGEAGYQADLLMPGWRWKFWVIYRVELFPWVQIPAGEIGVVIAQVGKSIPTGWKSAVYKPEFGNFSDLRNFLEKGGEKGVQRPVLPPGSLVPIHPVGFLVVTKAEVYGLPIMPELQAAGGKLKPQSVGLSPEDLMVVRIEPQLDENGHLRDMIGIVTTFEGEPLPSGDIASRLGGFKDVEEMEQSQKTDGEIIEVVLGNKNDLHNNYQDYQAFLDRGGKMGLQHDPLLYGAFTLNPYLVRVELVPMLMIKQGEVAVIKSYIGLASKDTSGQEFKFGSLVHPGHRGIWQEPLRTGKYALNPRLYEAVIVPTSILTLNWAEANSTAHNLDRQLKQINAKSREGFVFIIDLQVQIHVPDTKAPKVISMVGTMENLVNEVLQAAVGNHFRDKLQSMAAIKFIETRQEVQKEAMAHIKQQLEQYDVETRGVYIQDVILPQDLVQVLMQREIANQEIETYQKQKFAQETRIDMENAKGMAEMQAALAKSEVGIKIKQNEAEARKAEGAGEAEYLQKTGEAKGAEVRSINMARAEAYARQVAALGPAPTAMVNALTVLAEKGVRIAPDILVVGGNASSSTDGALAALMGYLQRLSRSEVVPEKPASAPEIK